MLVQRLLGYALDGETTDAIALQAIRDALDRAGLSAKHAVSVELGTPAYVEVFDAIVSTPITPAADEPLAISTGPLPTAPEPQDERTAEIDVPVADESSKTVYAEVVDPPPTPTPPCAGFGRCRSPIR